LGSAVVVTVSGGDVTVTLAWADFVVSAALVAVTFMAPEGSVVGAVYKPVEEIVPALALHVTDVFTVPLTVAVNCWVCATGANALVGERVTETTGTTVTAAWADLVVSATLTAVTVTLPPEATAEGAV
jgi:hypothetical protein